MRLKTLIAALTAMFFASALAAQAVPAPAPVPVPPADPENILNLDLSTGGRVSIQLRPDVAPAHVERIKALDPSFDPRDLPAPEHPLAEAPPPRDARAGASATAGAGLPEAPTRASPLMRRMRRLDRLRQRRRSGSRRKR